MKLLIAAFVGGMITLMILAREDPFEQGDGSRQAKRLADETKRSRMGRAHRYTTAGWMK